MRSLILPVVWALGCAAAAYYGTFPNPAARYEEEFVYATETVMTVCSLMTVQTLLLMAIYRPATFVNSWGRASLALLVSFLFLALGGIGAMHSPPAWGTMMAFQLAQFLAALALTVGAVLFAVVKPRTPE